MKQRQAIHILGICLGLCYAKAMPPSAWAGDLSDEPFAFRVSLSLDRTAAFSDVLARQASLAHPLGSSDNPATDDFLRDPPFDMRAVVPINTNQVIFESGAWLTSFSVTTGYRLEDRGTLSFTYVRNDTQATGSEDAMNDALRSNEFNFGYSHKVSPWLALGGGVSITDSTLAVDELIGGIIPGVGIRSQTHSDSIGVSFSLGALVALSEQWFVGLSGDMGWSRSETDGVALIPSGPPPAPLIASPVDITDTTHARAVGWGVGWRPSREVGVYSDWLYRHLESDQGSVDVGRWLLGVEVFLKPELVVRAGLSLDTFEEISLSTGVGYYGIEGLPLEIGYVYNAFPEVHPETGRAHLVSLSAVFVFK